MTTKSSAKKIELQNKLKETEIQLKSFQQQFRDIKKRAKESIKSVRKSSNNSKLAQLRKKLGLAD